MSQKTLFDVPEKGSFDDTKFHGPEYDESLDKDRLTGQIERVFECMKDGRYRTLTQIARLTGDPHASVSAQLRHLRNQHGYQVEKRRTGDRSKGLFEYKLTI